MFMNCRSCSAESKCTRKETVRISILVTSGKGDRKFIKIISDYIFYKNKEDKAILAV